MSTGAPDDVDPTQERLFGPGADRLLVDGRDVAPVHVARTRAEVRRGLLGTDRLVGALWLTRCPSVHMVGMRYPIDVAVLDRAGRVLLARSLRPGWGLTWPTPRRRDTVELPAGSLQVMGISVGTLLSVG